jgi:hypothetical protein
MNLSQDSCSPVRDLKAGPAEYETEVLTARNSVAWNLKYNLHKLRLQRADHSYFMQLKMVQTQIPGPSD